MIKLSAGRVYDPVHGVDGAIRDLFMDRGRIVARPIAGTPVDREYDLRGRVVMAGAIDLHTHIGGGKVNIARAMLPEDHRDSAFAATGTKRSGSGVVAPSTFAAGYRYAEMGYTACFEPAILPVNARQAHMEMADTPIVDKGGYAMLGNDDFLLRMLATGADQKLINDYVAWTLHATQCIAIKVVNPGGIS
ncbi:MAG: amidohydrolase family protein, partial [Betaproteobacteria bacterium]